MPTAWSDGTRIKHPAVQSSGAGNLAAAERAVVALSARLGDAELEATRAMLADSNYQAALHVHERLRTWSARASTAASLTELLDTVPIESPVLAALVSLADGVTTASWLDRIALKLMDYDHLLAARRARVQMSNHFTRHARSIAYLATEAEIIVAEMEMSRMRSPSVVAAAEQLREAHAEHARLLKIHTPPSTLPTRRPE